MPEKNLRIGEKRSKENLEKRIKNWYIDSFEENDVKKSLE